MPAWSWPVSFINCHNTKIFQNYLDSYYDHGTIVNKDDKSLLEFLKFNKQKHIIYDNEPTAENIAKKLTYKFYDLFKDKLSNITNVQIIINETEKNSAGFSMC